MYKPTTVQRQTPVHRRDQAIRVVLHPAVSPGALSKREHVRLLSNFIFFKGLFIPFREGETVGGGAKGDRQKQTPP